MAVARTSLYEGIAMMQLFLKAKQIKEAETSRFSQRSPSRTPSRGIRPRAEGGQRARGGVTKGAGAYQTASQKINLMKRGLQAQEESAGRMRKAALNDLLEYERASEAERASGPMSSVKLALLQELQGGGQGGGGSVKSSNIYTPGGGGNIGDFFEQYGTGQPGAIGGTQEYKNYVTMLNIGGVSTTDFARPKLGGR